MKDRGETGLYNLIDMDAVFHWPVVYRPQVGKSIISKYLNAAFGIRLNGSLSYVCEAHGKANAISDF